MNVVDVSGVSISTYGGLYHPSGAIRGRTAPTTLSGLQAPDGAYYFLGLFSPLNLFANGEQGAWYDPSDFSTMFQDSAGTTPVTAVEQPVGLILDKSKGLAIGSELVTNGDFSGGSTGWTNASLGTGTFTVSSGIATLTGVDASNRGALLQAITCVVGTTYRVTATVSGGSLNIAVGTGVLLDGTGGVSVTQTGAVSFVVVASATSLNLKAWNIAAGGTVTIDNISVKALAGNHASQSTSASRPVLSARVNLLTYSEQFDNAAWAKQNILAFGSGSVANATTAPDGTLTADLVLEDTATSTHYLLQSPTIGAGGRIFSVYAKQASGTRYLQFRPFAVGVNVAYANFNITDGVVVPSGTGGTAFVSASITPAGNGWYRCEMRANFASAPGGMVIAMSNGTGEFPSYEGNGTSGFYIWGADLRVTNDGVGIPAYQRVAAATDYDTSGFPLYLKFDGTDDSLATASIDFSGTDKMSVFAGVRKLSDAATGVVAELSTNAASNNGTFFMCGPATGGVASYNAYSKGTVGVSPSYTNASVAAPVTSVLTFTGDIPGDVATLRVNGSQVDSVTTDQGTGAFGNYALFIGSRNSASLRLNARLYSLIVRGAQSTDAQIASTETYVNNLTKAY